MVKRVATTRRQLGPFSTDDFCEVVRFPRYHCRPARVDSRSEKASDDQIPHDRDLTNGLAGLITLLRVRAAGRQKADNGQLAKKGFTSAHLHNP